MKRRDHAVPLGEREQEVLRTVIREHVLSGEPIGSRTVAGTTGVRLSPASIRTIMATLEERGLLAQPHTSAGRVPTDRAYRFYVDHLIGRPRVAAAQQQAIEVALAGSREVSDLLGEASRQLSQLSQQVGLVLAPELSRIVVNHLEFVRLDARRIVAILVSRAGVVHNRILEVAEPLDQAELDHAGRYLTDEFGGTTLPEMRSRLERKLREERAAYDRLVARSLELGRQAVEAEADSEVEVFVEGASNLVGSPEFADPERMRSLFRTLEEKTAIVGLLSRLLGSSGVQVVIGEENPLSDLARCSLVATSYGVGGRVLGTLGIVGPTRMGYARAIALVDHLAQVLTRLLS